MKKNIVVVEDFEVSRKIISNTLTKAGYNVFEASDGEEAINLFDGRSIDMLITDFNMPNMDGGELIEKVRAMEAYSYLPILLMTTDVRKEKIHIAISERVIALIKKPFDPTAFINIVNKEIQ
jgi:two-component system chemotaxis response regulator CheY